MSKDDEKERIFTQLETAIIDALVHAEPPPLSRLNYEVPPRLEDAVRKLLQKDPDARYQSARELLVDLRAVRQDPGVVGRRFSTSRCDRHGRARCRAELPLAALRGRGVERMK